MNWLGKVFVVLILLMSIVFMSLAMMVYATHKNWRDVIENPTTGLDVRLKNAQAENSQLKSELLRRTEELQAETEAEKQQVRKLETERVGLVERNAAIQAELDQKRQDERQCNHRFD